MAAVAIPAAEVIIGGLARAGTWLWRAYQAYRTAQALESLAQAQQQAKATQEKGKTDAQAKADAAVSSDCKHCNEDPDCETARDKLKEALQGTKNEQDETGRGLAERLCHWLHGENDADRASHVWTKDGKPGALQEAAKRAQKALDWLKGEGSRPVGKKEGARLTKAQKNKMLKDCYVPPDLEKDTKDLIRLSKQISKGESPIQPIPWKQSDTEPACKKMALELVKTGFGLQS